MEGRTNISRSKFDIALWTLVITLLIVGLFANYYYFGEMVWALRVIFWMFLAALLTGLFALTTHGKKFWNFVKEAKIELYKVIWPTRDETIKTTAVVAALVFAMSMILWLVDSLLLWVVGWLTR